MHVHYHFDALLTAGDEFSLLLSFTSFRSGVLCGDRGAAVHIPERTSLLQGHPWRHGKDLELTHYILLKDTINEKLSLVNKP